jgi:hypothetical protein
MQEVLIPPVFYKLRYDHDDAAIGMLLGPAFLETSLPRSGFRDSEESLNTRTEPSILDSSTLADLNEAVDAG